MGCQLLVMHRNWDLRYHILPLITKDMLIDTLCFDVRRKIDLLRKLATSMQMSRNVYVYTNSTLQE